MIRHILASKLKTYELKVRDLDFLPGQEIVCYLLGS